MTLPTVYAIELDFGLIWEAVDKGGTLALAILALVALVKGWVVPAWTYNDQKTRCDKTTEIAERGVELGERQAAAATVLLDQIRKLQQQHQEESAAALLAEIKDFHSRVVVPARVVVLPADEQTDKPGAPR